MRHCDSAPAGCGGAEFAGSAYGEIERMYGRPQDRGIRLGAYMLDQLADLARQNGTAPLRLETGIHQEAAIRHYEKYGSRRIPPFGEYEEDPMSIFYERQVAPWPFGRRAGIRGLAVSSRNLFTNNSAQSQTETTDLPNRRAHLLFAGAPLPSMREARRAACRWG